MSGKKIGSPCDLAEVGPSDIELTVALWDPQIGVLCFKLGFKFGPELLF